MIRRSRKAQSIVELCVGLLVMVPIVLVIFDLAIVVIGVQMNDSTCREAARIAASGSPDSTTLTNRAQAVVNRANQKGNSYLSQYTLISAVLSGVDNTQMNQAQTYGGSVTGSVTVRTQVVIKPFLVQWAYQGQPLTFVSQQTFPLTYVYTGTQTGTSPS